MSNHDELLVRSDTHIRQMAPHQRDRESAKLIVDLSAAIRDLEADANRYRELLKRLENHFPQIGQMLNVLESEWKQEGCWSAWDQETMTEQRAIHKHVVDIVAAMKGDSNGSEETLAVETMRSGS